MTRKPKKWSKKDTTALMADDIRWMLSVAAAGVLWADLQVPERAVQAMSRLARTVSALPTLHSKVEQKHLKRIMRELAKVDRAK